MKKHFFVFILLLLAEPVLSQGIQAEKIYVQRQDQTLKDPVLPELLRQVKAMGFQVEVFSGERPANAQHHLAYRSDWLWGVNARLMYLQADFYQAGELRSSVQYDAKFGGDSTSTSTADKIKPLLKALLKDVKPAGP